MATLTQWDPVRWDPFRELVNMRNMMERVFEDTFGPRVWQHEGEQWSLALDVAEEGDHFVVKASIPGVNPDDLEISLTNDVLTIKGETKADQEIKEENYHLRERRYGSFLRSITLPVHVDAEKVDAHYENGILKLTLPKSEEMRPKKIAIKGNGGRTIEAKK